MQTITSIKNWVVFHDNLKGCNFKSLTLKNVDNLLCVWLGFSFKMFVLATQGCMTVASSGYSDVTCIPF